MISQNRADEKRQIIAVQEWKSVQIEEQRNEELLRLSKQILELTDAIRKLSIQPRAAHRSPNRGGEVAAVVGVRGS